MNFYHTLKYLEHLIFSGHRRGHGIHSPLIFDLVSRVFRNKTDSEVVLRIEKIRKKLRNDPRMISMNDLGAGKEKYRNKNRKVSDIARYSAVQKKTGVLLSGLAAEFGNGTVVELGTSLGISAMYLASSNPECRVYTIEGCSQCASLAKENFREAGFNNIRSFTGSFDAVLPELFSAGVKPGMVFIDGNHRKVPLLKYFSMISQACDENTVVVIDDIYYSHEMSEAWDQIRHSENVSATLDLFRMGIVFFRKSITCNHYKIRY